MTQLALASLFLWFALLALRNWRLHERLESDPAIAAYCADVTALIPARNEERHLARCIAAVTPQVSTVVVVDDESCDATATIATAAGAELVQGLPTPPGWSGKLWALQQGLGRARTPWVLLLDADVEVGERLVATMQQRAHDSGLTLLSLMVELRMRTLAERWLMPAFVYFFRMIYPFRRANDASSSNAAAAGGCLLVRRSALESTGAFESLHDAIIDDCTLARRVKDKGFNTWIGLTRSVRSWRGYGGLAEITEMVARTAYTQLRYSPWLLAACTVAMMLAFWVPAAALVLGPEGARLAGLAALSIMLITFIPLLRYYGMSPGWGAALPAAATAYLVMTWLSAWRYANGVRSRWKERTYSRHGDAARGG